MFLTEVAGVTFSNSDSALVPNFLNPDPGPGFSQIFDSGSARKTQNPAGVDSGNPDPVPPLVFDGSSKYCPRWV